MKLFLLIKSFVLFMFDGNDKSNIFDIILHYFDTGLYQLITFIIFVCMCVHAHT